MMMQPPTRTADSAAAGFASPSGHGVPPNAAFSPTFAHSTLQHSPPASALAPLPAEAAAYLSSRFLCVLRVVHTSPN